MTSFVWDLDGTLIDSYGAILHALEATYKHYGWDFERNQVHAYILEYSVGQLLDEMAEQGQVIATEVKAFYSADLKQRDEELSLYPDTQAVLEWTRSKGIQNFIYTHKGSDTLVVLEKLGIADYFTEALHGQSGFTRKPHREAMDYLVNRYGLDRAQTYYIGDRKLDMEFAVNSKVHSVNLSQPDSLNNTHIASLSELPALLFFKEI